MTVWLYQMNPQRELEDGDVYTPDDFREELASEDDLEWLTREIRPRHLEPKAGDTIIYWFVVSGTEKPGIYGVGTILGCYKCPPEYNTEYNCIRHSPAYLSEDLQYNPLDEAEIREIVNEIRGTDKAFATMFKLDDDQAERLFAYIRGNDE